MESRPARIPTADLHRAGLALVLAGVLVAQVFLLAAAAQAVLLVPVALAAALPLATLGRWPLPSFALMVAAAAFLAYSSVSGPFLWAALAVGVYVVASGSGRRGGLLAGVVAALALALPGAAARGLTLVGAGASLATMAALMVAAAAFGEANRSRHERVAEAEKRAEQAELAREAQAALAAEEERLRIARELHDVTAHSLSVIAIQSELARRSLHGDPDTAERALDAVGETSRRALGELRAMLGALRETGEGEPLVPAPSLARTDDVVARLEEAGVQVRLSAEGIAGRALPPFIDAAAFRIVQEAATNVVRHAGATHASIEVRAEDGALRVTVTDDGAGGAAGAREEGHGIRGMRERAAAAGGTLEAGPLPAGGWRVEARLPLRLDGETGEGA